MHNGPWLTRLARRLILDVRQGRDPDGFEVLDELGTHDPKLLVDLLLEVARHVDDAVVARIVTDRTPIDVPLPELVRREAHRRHYRGDAGDWVSWGERAYQCARQRTRRRQRA